MTKKVTTKNNLVKICSLMRTHEAKTCECMSKRAHTHIYASCALNFTQNLTRIVLIVYYYITTLSLKFHKDLSFCCGDICKITLNMYARGIIKHAKFQHLRLHVFALCASVCAQILTKFFLVVYYSVIRLRFKFDPFFCCGDIYKIEWGFFLATTVIIIYRFFA